MEDDKVSDRQPLITEEEGNLEDEHPHCTNDEETDEAKNSNFEESLDVLVKHIFQSETKWKIFLRLVNIPNELIMITHESKKNDKDQEVCLRILKEHCDQLPNQELSKFKQEVEEKLSVLLKTKKTAPQTEMSSNECTSKLVMRNCTTQVLQVIAIYVAPYWENFGRKLKCSLHDLDLINIDFNDSLEKAFQCLNKVNKNNNNLQLSNILSTIRNDENIPNRVYRNCVGDLKKILKLEKDFMSEDNLNHYIKIAWEDVVMITHSSLTEHRELEEQVKTFEDKKNSNQIVTIDYDTYSTRVKKSDLLAKSKEYLNQNSQKFYYSPDTSEDITSSSGFANFIKKNGQGYLFYNYNIMEHFKFLHLEMCIKDYHFEKSQSSHVMDYIGATAADKTIYFIKMSKAVSLEQLKKDIDESAAFVRMFVLLHKDYFSDEIQYLLSLLVIPDESKCLVDELPVICNHCKDFIIANTQLEDFDFQLQTHFHELIQQKIENTDADANKVKCFSKFENAVASIVGFMHKEVIFRSHVAQETITCSRFPCNLFSRNSR